jgi:hypothetical protein
LPILASSPGHAVERTFAAHGVGDESDDGREELNEFDRSHTAPPPATHRPGSASAAKRDRSESQRLLHQLFGLQLSERYLVKQRLCHRGFDAVARHVGEVLARHDLVQRLSPAEFHVALNETFGDNGDVTRAETDMLFELFAANGSRGIDVAEFEKGLRLLVQGEHVLRLDYCHRMTLRSRCRNDAVVSALEVELMYEATAYYYRGHPAAFRRELAAAMDATRRLLGGKTRKGELMLRVFQGIVDGEPLLRDAIEALPHSRFNSDRAAPSPDPDKCFLRTAGAGRQAVVASDAPAGEDGRPRLASVRDGLSSLGEELCPPSHPHFVADSCLAGRTKQRGVDEPERWYASFGQLWRVRRGGAPEPMF